MTIHGLQADLVLWDELHDLLTEAEARGLVSTACDTHDGVPMTEAEVAAHQESPLCLPVFRLWDRPSVGEG